VKYQFSLIPTATDVTEEQADMLYDSGCDDGSILSRGEVTLVQFDRGANKLDDALASAIRDVEQAGFQVARIEIERDEATQIA